MAGIISIVLFAYLILFVCSLEGVTGGLFGRLLGLASRGRRGTGERRRRGLPHAGLVNLGNTCYMNSLLQGLFYIDSFRGAVMSAAYAEGSAGAELQYIFRRLGDVDNRCPVDTVGLARTLDLNVNIQEDSQEFYLKLMNRLKDGLGSNSVNPADVFQGEFTQVIACPQKEFEKSKVQTFKDISADVHGHTSLSVSLEDLFQPETLSGYVVPNHGEQVVEKKISIRTLPKALCVHLKRFEFDVQQGRMMKIGQFLEFPMNLDLSHYYKGLEHTTTLGQRKQSTAYKLSAIVIHDGTSSIGHYTCIARPGGQEEWILLNDKMVSETDVAEISEVGFGGYEKQLGRDFSSKNAYLLFYEGQ